MERRKRQARVGAPSLVLVALATWLACLSAPRAAAESNVFPMRCTVILQTRVDRLYCLASNQPLRVNLRRAENFAKGEVLDITAVHGITTVTNLSLPLTILLGASVHRLGVTNLPSPLRLQPQDLTNGLLNYRRVAVVGRVTSHERMYFDERYIEIILAQSADGQPFRVEVLHDSKVRERLPIGTEADFVGLSYTEVLVDEIGPEAQIDMENLDDCTILHQAPWLTLERARGLVFAGAVLAVVGGLWFVRERYQIRRLLAADRTVRRLNSELEGRVAQRTADLSAANAQLKEEVAVRERAEKEVQRALAHEKELSELKSRFVSMVSHEFRTPLGIIMSSAEILDAYLDRLPPEERRANLRDITQSSKHMAAMMEEVLLLGRVEAGKLTCRPVPLDLMVFCAKLADEVTSATTARCPIDLKVAPGLGEVMADESLLRHILTNLLNNAVKYSPAGTKVEFEVAAKEHLAIFTVRDHGIGIPEADQRQLFQAFHRGRNVGETAGTGLGMVIVKHCVSLHGGKIAFESKEGLGTTFTVALPLFQLPSANSNGSSTQLFRAALGGGEATVVS